MRHLFSLLGRISITGFPTFFSDVGIEILTILFNRQILRYFGNDALSVYGIIISLSTLVQCTAYSISQDAQPILSMNFGAAKESRIRQVLYHSTITSIVFGLIWMAVCEFFPDSIIRIFMKPTGEILHTGIPIVRIYAVSFLQLPLNIFSAYYYQALLKPKGGIYRIDWPGTTDQRNNDPASALAFWSYSLMVEHAAD